MAYIVVAVCLLPYVGIAYTAYIAGSQGHDTHRAVVDGNYIGHNYLGHNYAWP